jgi:hypothetical protein
MKIKRIDPLDQPSLVAAADRPMSVLVETPAHIKSASTSESSRVQLRDHMPPDDYFGVHCIAMGGYDRFGFNDNGDAWPSHELMKRASTFVTHGHYFQEHDLEKAKGFIKAAAYIPEKDWIEVVYWGNKRKAPDIYEKVKQGKALRHSMSAAVPYDECGACGHHSHDKEGKDRCTHIDNYLLQYIPGLKKYAYMINHKPIFIDLSEVADPAFSPAWSLETAFSDGKLKAASKIIEMEESGELPAGFNLPELQIFIDQETAPDNLLIKSAKVSVVPVFEDELYENLKGIPATLLMQKTAESKTPLPFIGALSLLLHKSPSELRTDRDFQAAYHKHASRAITLMSKNPECRTMVSDLCDPLAEVRYPNALNQAVSRALVKTAARYSMGAQPDFFSDFERIPHPGEYDSETAKKMAAVYGVYKVAFILNSRDRGLNLSVDPLGRKLITIR